MMIEADGFIYLVFGLIINLQRAVARSCRSDTTRLYHRAENIAGIERRSQNYGQETDNRTE